MVGVDHARVNNQIYVLECNGSPGIGSKFASYKTDLKDREYVGPTSSENVVKKLFDYLTQDAHRKHSFTKESGFQERIIIDGYGPVRAKFDTGNSGTNVIHAEKMEVKGNKIKPANSHL